MVVELELESALALDFAIRISTALGVLREGIREMEAGIQGG